MLSNALKDMMVNLALDGKIGEEEIKSLGAASRIVSIMEDNYAGYVEDLQDRGEDDIPSFEQYVREVGERSEN